MSAREGTDRVSAYRIRAAVLTKQTASFYKKVKNLIGQAIYLKI
jgi:hypothetical protein